MISDRYVSYQSRNKLTDPYCSDTILILARKLFNIMVRALRSANQEFETAPLRGGLTASLYSVILETRRGQGEEVS